MGLPAVTLFAKLKLLSVSSHTSLVSPLLTSFLCPFLVKLAFSLRLVHGAYNDVIYSSRLFFFQLGRITFDDNRSGRDHQQQQQQVDDIGDRWARAMRLIWERISQARRSFASTASNNAIAESDEDSFHALSMFSL